MHFSSRYWPSYPDAFAPMSSRSLLPDRGTNSVRNTRRVGIAVRTASRTFSTHAILGMSRLHCWLIIDLASMPATQKLRWTHNLDGLILFEHQQVFVPGDDVECGCRDLLFTHKDRCPANWEADAWVCSEVSNRMEANEKRHAKLSRRGASSSKTPRGD